MGCRKRKAQELSELSSFYSSTGLTATTRNHIIKWLTDWVREYGVDGFRVDTYKHVEGDAWASLKTQSIAALAEWKAANPSEKLDDLPFWMVAEDFGHGPGKDQNAINNGFDAVINFDLQTSAGNISSMEGIFSNYASIVNPDPSWNILSYLSSHDIQLFDRNNLINGGTSLLLCPGAAQIYYGDETARPFGATGSDPQYDDGTNQDAVVVVVGTNGTTTVDVSSVFPEGASVKDFYTGDEATVINGTITLAPHSNGVMLLEESGVSPNPVVTINGAPSGCLTSSQTVSISASDPIDPNPTIYYTYDAKFG